MSSQPIFILSSGRSGTYSLFNALKNEKEIEIYHEFLFDETLRNSVSYYMGLINEKKIINYLGFAHEFSIKNSKKKIWIDSSNALPWMVKPLIKKFKNAKFIFLIRNGRKVVSSFSNKYSDIMYNRDDVILLKKFMDKLMEFNNSLKQIQCDMYNPPRKIPTMEETDENTLGKPPSISKSNKKCCK